MTAQLFVPPARATDSNANPLSGAKWYFYLTGTTTPHAVYAEASLSTSLGPVVSANSAGVFVPIFLDPAITYRAILKDVDDVPIPRMDFDPISDVRVASLTSDLASTASGKGAWLVKWISSLAGAVARWVGDKLSDTVSAKDFGAVGDDAADDLAALQAAAAASAEVYLPAGTYRVSGTINISKEKSNWHGPGIIKATTANLPIFTIASGISGTKIRVATLTRSVTATAGGNGIECSTVSVGQAIIGPMKIEKQYIGANLGPTDYSYVKEVIFENCVLDGAAVTNTASDGACQWQFKGCLSQFIGRNGYTWQTIAGPAQMTAGDMENCDAYACSGRAVVVNGTAGVPIMDFSMNGGFYGESGDSVVYINTYGRNTTISGVLAELAGRTATGVNAATPASLIGSGFEITSNNVRVQFDNCLAPGNSYDGFYDAATITCLNGCSAENNGQSATAGRRNGLNSVSGYTSVNGGYWGNTAGSSQSYGCFVADGNNLAVNSATFASNGVAPWGATSNVSRIVSGGNLPNNIPYAAKPRANVTGRGTNGACTINSSSNITSVTRSALGVYDVVMTNALPDIYYTVSAMARGGVILVANISATAKTTTTFSLTISNLSGTGVDPTDFEFTVSY